MNCVYLVTWGKRENDCELFWDYAVAKSFAKSVRGELTIIHNEGR